MSAHLAPLLVRLATPVTIKTPLQITASSPIPVSFPTPLHVYSPDSPVAWATLVFAFLGFVVSLIAIRMTYIDLRNQREQMDELRRRPKLEVRLTIKPSDIGGAWRCHLNLFNIGNKTASHYRARIYFPASTRVNEFNANFQREGHYYLAPTVIGGESYLIREHPLRHTIEYDPDRRLYINDDGYELEQLLVELKEPTVVLWDADDDDGHYPKLGRYGAIRIRPIDDPKVSEIGGEPCALPDPVVGE